MFREKAKRVMFIGDNHLDGFKQHFIKKYQKHTFIESLGKEEKVYTLKARLKSDVLKEKPDIVVISVGTYDSEENKKSIYSGTYTSMEHYDSLYRDIIEMLDKAGVENIVLVEPFYVSTLRIYDHIRFDVQDKIYVVRRIASDYHCKLIATDGILNQMAINEGKRKAVALGGMKIKKQGREYIMNVCEEILMNWGVR